VLDLIPPPERVYTPSSRILSGARAREKSWRELVAYIHSTDSIPAHRKAHVRKLLRMWADLDQREHERREQVVHRVLLGL
jgi:hypothetical protein